MAGTDVFIESIPLADFSDDDTSGNNVPNSENWSTNASATTGTTPADFTVAQAGTVDGVALACNDLAGSNMKVAVVAGTTFAGQTAGDLMGLATVTTAQVGSSATARYYVMDLAASFEVAEGDQLQVWVMTDALHIACFEDTDDVTYNFMVSDTSGSYASPPSPQFGQSSLTNRNRRKIGFQALGTFDAGGILVPTGPWYGADGKQIKQHPG